MFISKISGVQRGRLSPSFFLLTYHSTFQSQRYKKLSSQARNLWPGQETDEMVSLKDVQGRIYSFKSKTELLKLGIIVPDIPDIARRHKVLVLCTVPSKKHYVRVMTVSFWYRGDTGTNPFCDQITSKLKNIGDYVPISPTPKKGFPIQIQLANNWVWSRGQTVPYLTILSVNSYLKIDSYYEVPIQMLKEFVDNLGYQMMIYTRHRGGLGELRNHIQCRDKVRRTEELCRAMEKQTLEEDGVWSDLYS